jgi:copper chaperone
MKAEIVVENIKCGGCAATIQKELKTLQGVDRVEIDVNSGTVTIHYFDIRVAESAKKKLDSLGYPEIGSQRGLEKAASKAKSFVSCAVGKLS